MDSRYANFEARFQYSLFLTRTGRHNDAKQLLDTIVDEGAHLSSRERRANSEWIGRAKDEAKKLNTVRNSQ